jgi:transposase
VCALLAGAYRVGKRGAARLCGDLFGVPISSAAVCDLQRKTAAALEPVVAAAHAYVAGKPANVDETGWREGQRRGWLWVAATASVTVFLVRLSRARAVLADLIPGGPGVLTTDRYPAYGHLPVGERQVCLLGAPQPGLSGDDRPAERRVAGGEDLLLYADILLGQWKRVRDGTLTRRGFRQSYLGWIREEVLALLGRGAGSECPATAGVCRELLAVEPAQYTFAAVKGGADEQRGRAGAPPRRLLAEDELRDRLRGRESVRRAGAHRCSDLPPTGPRRARLPGPRRRGGRTRRAVAVPAARGRGVTRPRPAPLTTLRR